MHETEKKRVISMLKRLVAQGNTVIVVEHDIEMIRSADYIIDIGPYAGKNGGTCLYQGPISGYDSCKASIVLNYYKNPSLQRLKVRDFSLGQIGRNCRSFWKRKIKLVVRDNSATIDE